MTTELLLLVGAAVSVAFVHTLAGPDHYLPFVAMARAGTWSRRRTIWVTTLCGIGHVTSSILLALVGVLLFRGADHLVDLETLRGDLAAWGLILFGLVYGAWGLRRARRGHVHTHRHTHVDGTVHEHRHEHSTGHAHRHGSGFGPWALFLIFVLGPCEPLIPMLIYAAERTGPAAATLVAATFALVTVLTMLAVVLVALGGLRHVRMPRLERYEHAVAGLTILACGLGIRFLGL